MEEFDVEVTLEARDLDEVNQVTDAFLLIKKVLGNDDFIAMAKKLEEDESLVQTVKSAFG